MKSEVTKLALEMTAQECVSSWDFMSSVSAANLSLGVALEHYFIMLKDLASVR